MLIDDRYLVLERVAGGGTATVYRAEDQVLRRTVALKLPHSCFADDPEFIERFRREACSAANLHHPRIVTVYDRGEWDGTHYIAMEYVPGRSLKALIRAEAPLDPAWAIDLAVQLLHAAGYIHRRGVIHRDLTPRNVLIDAAGGLKLVDFGTARADDAEITQTGTLIGTAQYISPEQAQGKAATIASDLYSIGVILYELLTGQVPFQDETAVATLLRHVKDRPAPPRTRNPAITGELEKIVMRALEKQPSSRFPDADAFLAALEDARARLPAGDLREAAKRSGVGRDSVSERPVETRRLRLVRRARLVVILSALKLARLRSAHSRPSRRERQGPHRLQTVRACLAAQRSGSTAHCPSGVSAA